MPWNFFLIHVNVQSLISYLINKLDPIVKCCELTNLMLQFTLTDRKCNIRFNNNKVNNTCNMQPY